jgi:hypothetical protein
MAARDSSGCAPSVLRSTIPAASLEALARRAPGLDLQVYEQLFLGSLPVPPWGFSAVGFWASVHNPNRGDSVVTTFFEGS